jgi:hypothetical protein
MQHMAPGFFITHRIALTAKAAVYAADSTVHGQVALKHLRVVPDEDDMRPLAKLQNMLKLHTGKLQSESGSFTHVVPVLAVVQDQVSA